MNELIKFEDVKQIANSFIKSNLFYDTKSVEVAIVKIMAGHELGLQPFQAMQSFDIIQGKVFVKPILLSGLLKKGGKYDYRIIESTDKICRIEFYEGKGLIGESIVTIEECIRMGLTNKDNWKKQPNTMLFNRCMSQGIRRFAPDLYLMPIYTEGDEWFDVKEPKQENKPKFISGEQVKQLFEIESKTKYGLDNMKKYIQSKYNKQSSKELTIEEFQDCVLEMESTVINDYTIENEIFEIQEDYYGKD